MGERYHNDDVIYVAVNQRVRESKENLLWTLKDRQFKKLVLLHIHAPFSLTTSSCGLQQNEIDAIQDSEVKTSYSSLRKYRIICTDKGINEEDVDTLCISGYDVGEEIVTLIYQNNIKKLVMGAAADPHYSKKMSITSKKAKYVSENAPRGCRMWFVCKGKLITTIQGNVDFGNPPANITEEYPIGVQRVPKNLNNGPGNSTGSVSKPGSTPSPLHEFICPLTKEIMREPYLAADGHTYELEVIREYLSKGNKMSPITKQPLQHYNLTLNRAVYAMIKDWQEANPNYED